MINNQQNVISVLDTSVNVSLDTLPDTPLSVQPCVLLISPQKKIPDVIVDSSLTVPINITLDASVNASLNASLNASVNASLPAQTRNFDIISPSTRTDYPSWSTKRPIYKYKLPNYNNTGLTYPVMFEKIQNLVQELIDPHKEIKYYGGGKGLRIQNNIYDVAIRASLLLDKTQCEQFVWNIPFDNFRVVISPETTDEERDICITILGLYIFIACEHTSDNASNDVIQQKAVLALFDLTNRIRRIESMCLSVDYIQDMTKYKHNKRQLIREQFKQYYENIDTDAKIQQQ